MCCLSIKNDIIPMEYSMRWQPEINSIQSGHVNVCVNSIIVLYSRGRAFDALLTTN